MASKNYKVTWIKIEEIAPNPQQRPIDKAAVNAIKKSISHDGLNNPLVVIHSEDDWDSPSFVLQSGGHRFQACKELGMKEVPCHVIKRKAAPARAASDNLHRARYSKLQKALDLVQYAKANLDDLAKWENVQKNDKGISKVSRALGISGREVGRAYAVAGLEKGVRDLLQRGGLDDSRKLLDKLVSLNSEKERIAEIDNWKNPTEEGSRARSFGKLAKLHHGSSKKSTKVANETTDQPIKKSWTKCFDGVFRTWKISEASKQFEQCTDDMKIAFIRKAFDARLLRRAVRLLK